MSWKKIRVQMEQLGLELGLAQALDRRSLGQILALVRVGCVWGRSLLRGTKGYSGGQPGTGGACRAVGHSMCPLCSAEIESYSGPSWCHLGTLPIPGLELCVLSFPGGPCCPEPTSRD